MTTTDQHLPHLLIANSFHPDTVAILDTQYQTHKIWLLDGPVEQQSMIERLAPICQAVASASWATNPLIYQLPNLKIISCFGVGTDGIDFGITRARGIAVTNTPKVLNDAVADLAMGLVLATSRNLINADRYVRDGKWLQAPFPFAQSLAGKTLGIIGLGAIGEEIADRALPFKMRIAYHNRQPKNLPYQYCDSIEALARESDILLSMLPGGTATEKILGTAIFRALGPQGIFINVGRGTSVDEDALVSALQQGVIAGAGLDVYAREPHVPEALLGMSNVVLFPHIGSATVETRRAMGQLVVDNLAAHFSGKALLTPC
ncbi:MAG: 2-hydroxyacid dehydrogenase [Gammaproteobacteria bacterium]|nr:2-hydroxyacid dehydrogenase [Gammaproteobacteria bacterium]MDP2141841.1 2-hydroxyacid dehydrogenase [Gammaproteobacteria bacterium]MDP2348332.1 2-hydroxyacid dehydrogenase [Gammaproteobacteria bacterium]